LSSELMMKKMFENEIVHFELMNEYIKNYLEA